MMFIVTLFLPTASAFLTTPPPQHQVSFLPLQQPYTHPSSLKAESSYESISSSSTSGEVELQVEPQEEEEENIVVGANEETMAVLEDYAETVADEFEFPPTTTTYFLSQEENEPDLQTSMIDQEQLLTDESFMRMAIDLAKKYGGERGPASAYPNPSMGAVIVADDGRILGKGRSNYRHDAIQDVLRDVGLQITPLREWCVTWPSSMRLRNDLAAATLYVTLEPNAERRGQAFPPLTQLIELSGVSRVVIGCASPIPEQATKGAQALHQAGMDVSMGMVLVEECQDLIALYTERVMSKLQIMARKHREFFHRPLGFLHCSVVDSSDLEAFAQHGNAFGTSFGGQVLSERNFGSYEFAPPPEIVWADNQDAGVDEEMQYLMGMEVDDDDHEEEAMMTLDFYEETPQEQLGGVSMMPWYEQVDAVIATFPNAGNNGPTEENDSVKSRLNGLKWLATYGNDLPAGVERILVMDATDLDDLPLSNDDPNLPSNVDVEAFWAGVGRRPTRVLLRKGKSAQAKAAAKAAAA
jgi:pyrimidine deaminase RibD-like protein